MKLEPWGQHSPMKLFLNTENLAFSGTPSIVYSAPMSILYRRNKFLVNHDGFHIVHPSEASCCCFFFSSSIILVGVVYFLVSFYVCFANGTAKRRREKKTLTIHERKFGKRKHKNTNNLLLLDSLCDISFWLFFTYSHSTVKHVQHTTTAHTFILLRMLVFLFASLNSLEFGAWSVQFEL